MQHEFFSNNQISLYYNVAESKWYVENKVNHSSYDLSIKDNFMSILQIFYEDPQIIISQFNKTTEEYGLNKDILNSLPLNDVIAFCIENYMSYWVELSLKWIKYISVNDKLQRAIKEAVGDNKYPQKIRHQLIKFIRE
jgi:hypothetical protein